MHKIPKGTALAFDFGEARIGVAQGDAELNCPSAGTVTGGSNDEKFAAIAKLVQEWQPRYFVVGLPVHADGTEHEMTHLSRKFGRRLNGRFNLPVYWVDERLSSVYAESLLSEAQVLGKNANRCSTKWRRKPSCTVFSRAVRRNVSTGVKVKRRG